ncbi:hypothetical protein CLV98_107148 [Dyadobacter jejuensis]|uniref:Outer membrane protein with beta-barrel domain n=1 Tax=Dyadobacter jejuensis TaxID=1082580 RepID=A0A316AKP6_9BACT|nr:hypothetical protein [Dyadobacter jejuensis]PWJ57440.1 hypothetical protein CLV98_107148 [Dyadobacter jejuensis]
MKKLSLVICILFASLSTAFAQDSLRHEFLLDAGIAIGPSTFSGVGAFQYDRFVGKKKRIILGTGLRLTGFAGNDLNFISAPSSLTSNDSSIDTLLAPSPRLYSANLMLNLGYKFNEQWQAGFSIDVFGFSIGPTGSPRYISEGKYRTVSAKPTSPNYLLIGDNDNGTLNSQFYVKYKFSKHFGAKVAYQYLFNELRTTTTVQTQPEPNNRFRYKSSSAYVGAYFVF